MTDHDNDSLMAVRFYPLELRSRVLMLHNDDEFGRSVAKTLDAVHTKGNGNLAPRVGDTAALAC